MNISNESRGILISVMIPTFNRANLLRHALLSVLVQDLGQDYMEIVVVDDCSNIDNTKAVVDEIGKGRVQFFQQKENVGQMKNLNACIEISKGKLIHILHCDDMVLPGFYDKIIEAFTNNSGIGAAFCRTIFMNNNGDYISISPLLSSASGLINNWIHKIYEQQLIQTPSIVVKREVYQKVGEFRTDLAMSEDWEMWVRISEKYPVWHINETLSLYRSTDVSTTKKNHLNGQFSKDLKYLINFYFLKHKDRRIYRKSNMLYSNYLMSICVKYIVDCSIPLRELRNIISDTICFPFNLLLRFKFICNIGFKITRYRLKNAIRKI